MMVPPNDVQEERHLRRPARQARFSREDGGESNQEKKCGEYQVGWREAIPGSVFQRPIGVFAIGIVIDQDHEADGEAAQRVD